MKTFLSSAAFQIKETRKSKRGNINTIALFFALLQILEDGKCDIFWLLLMLSEFHVLIYIQKQLSSNDVRIVFLKNLKIKFQFIFYSLQPYWSYHTHGNSLNLFLWKAGYFLLKLSFSQSSMKITRRTCNKILLLAAEASGYLFFQVSVNFQVKVHGKINF